MNRSVIAALSLVLLTGAGAAPARAEDFNTQVVNATFKLENPQSTATAFLFTRPANGRPEPNRFILVTAAHVLEKMAGHEATLVLRRKEAEGVYKKLPLKLAVRKDNKPLWVKHPAMDVAVMEVTIPDNAEVSRLSLDLLASDASLKQYQVHPGDTLRCMGYPYRMEANEAGFPILRSGVIASFPLTPARTNRTFLMNYNVFEGDSGGPVYLAEDNRRLEGQKQPARARLIVGLVMGQHFLNQEMRTVYETRQVRHRLGIAIIIQAAYIRETIARLPQAPKS